MILKSGSMVWKWVDESALDYTYWTPGEPNSGDGPDFCGQLWYTGDGKHDGHWDDIHCNTKLSFVCQKRRGIFSLVLMLQ